MGETGCKAGALGKIPEEVRKTVESGGKQSDAGVPTSRRRHYPDEKIVEKKPSSKKRVRKPTMLRSDKRNQAPAERRVTGVGEERHSPGDYRPRQRKCLPSGISGSWTGRES